MSNRNKFNRSQQQQPQRQQAADVFEEPEVDPVVYDETGKSIGITGATGGPGQTGEKGPEGPKAPVESIEEEPEPSWGVDEREDEDDPALDQDHDETETEDGDEIVEDADPGVDSEGGNEGEDLGDVTTDKADLDIEPTEPEDEAIEFPFTEMETWTQAQLELYISRPENMDVYHSKLLKAIAMHRMVFTVLDSAWSVDECTAYFKEGITPSKTSTGAWVNDVTRKQRRESSWTTQELEAWALGELKAEGVVTSNGLAIELHQRFAMPISSVAPEIVIAHYKHNFGPNKGQVKLVGERPVAKVEVAVTEQLPAIETKITYEGLNEMSQSYIEESLKRYVDLVRPNRIVTDKVGFAAQRDLDTLLHYILKQEDPVGVKSGLDILFKAIVAERITNPRGVFNDTNAFRFVGGISDLARAQETHRRMLTLFFAFIDGDEGILSQTDVPTLIEYLPARHQNLLQGYLGRS